MTMEDKEIKFWLSVDKKPPYIDECGMNWDDIKNEYINRQNMLKQEGIKEEIELYNNIIDNITQNEINELLEDGILPEKLLSIIDVGYQNGIFKSKKWGIQLGTIYDIIDKNFIEKNENDDIYAED